MVLLSVGWAVGAANGLLLWFTQPAGVVYPADCHAVPSVHRVRWAAADAQPRADSRQRRAHPARIHRRAGAPADRRARPKAGQVLRLRGLAREPVRP